MIEVNSELKNEESVSEDEILSSCSDSSSILSIPSDKLKIIFDIVGTSIEGSFRSKHVVFEVLVTEASKPVDNDGTIIRARYADFESLHKALSNEIPDVMKRVPFPKKKYFVSSLKDTVVEARSRSLEKYLQYVYHQEAVKQTKAFRQFFFEKYFMKATEHLVIWEYESSRDDYYFTWCLQKKLGDNSEFIIPTMCGLVESCRNLKDYNTVNSVGTECLDIMEYDVNSLYLLPLMHCVIDARKRLQINCDWLKSKFKESKETTPHDPESIQLIHELLAKKL